MSLSRFVLFPSDPRGTAIAWATAFVGVDIAPSPGKYGWSVLSCGSPVCAQAGAEAAAINVAVRNAETPAFLPIVSTSPGLAPLWVGMGKRKLTRGPLN